MEKKQKLVNAECECFIVIKAGFMQKLAGPSGSVLSLVPSVLSPDSPSHYQLKIKLQ